MRPTCLTDMLLPSCMKSRTDIDDPNRAWLNTDSADPMRPTCLTDMALPRCMKSRTDTDDPNRA